MTQYDRTNTGVLRTNERKEKQSQPDWRGEININGTEYWLSAWTNEHPNMGGAYYKLNVQPKDDKALHAAKKKVEQTPTYGQVEDDNIPF